MEYIREVITRQIKSNSHINLFFNSLADTVTTNDDFTYLLRQLTESGYDISAIKLNELTDFTVETALSAIYGMNQYISVSSEHKRDLHTIYRTTLETIRQTGEIESTLLNHHYPAIRDWLERLYPPILADKLRNVEKINSAVCEEYSAEFQVALLGIDTDKIMEPVIDIGCGKSFHLVKHLHEQGIASDGIDRQLDEKEPYLHNTSWLDFNFTPGTWGTVIAHMSFSNHIIHHYTLKTPSFAEHARTYHEILESLRPGGMFVYAPGVEFIEKHIDRDLYRVICTPVFNTVTRTHVIRK